MVDSYKDAGYNGVAISLPAVEDLIESLQQGCFPAELAQLYPESINKPKVRASA